MIKVETNQHAGQEFKVALFSNLSMSLDRFFAVFLVLSAVTLMVAMYPLMLGLWPVMAIALIHILCVGLCFRSAWRGNWARQTLHFGAETVTIEHLARDEQWSIEWPLPWLRLVEKQDPRGHHRLFLAMQGQTKEIGGFLPDQERQALGELLTNTLAQRTAWGA